MLELQSSEGWPRITRWSTVTMLWNTETCVLFCFILFSEGLGGSCLFLHHVQALKAKIQLLMHVQKRVSLLWLLEKYGFHPLLSQTGLFLSHQHVLLSLSPASPSALLWPAQPILLPTYSHAHAQRGVTSYPHGPQPESRWVKQPNKQSSWLDW